MELSKKQTVTINNMDTQGYLSTVGHFQLIQEAITELMGMHELDGATVRRKYGAIWVFVKTHADFFGKLYWHEDFTVNAYFSYISVAKINIDVELLNTAGEKVMHSRTELCALDIETQRIRRSFTVGMDAKYLTDRKVEDMEFGKFEDCDTEVVDSVKIKSTNIDFAYHTNNSEYLKIIMDTYTVKETENMTIKGADLLYAGQSFEGDTLTVRKAVGEHAHRVVLEKNGSPVIKCAFIL